MSDKSIEDKKPRWETFMVVGKYYHVKYRYGGKEFEDGGTFKEWKFGNFYFKCDNGEWMILKPGNIISAITS